MPPTSVTGVLVNSGVPVPPELLYRLKVTVPVGLLPPVRVAESEMEAPTVALAGCWLVLMLGVAFELVIAMLPSTASVAAVVTAGLNW